MLQTLFDEKRRAEIRNALRTGKPIPFRAKPAAAPDSNESGQAGVDSIVPGLGVPRDTAIKFFRRFLSTTPPESGVRDLTTAEPLAEPIIQKRVAPAGVRGGS